MTEMRGIKLPADLCAAVEKRYERSFGSLEQLLEYVMRELARDLDSQADDAEQRLLEERLRDLGYL
jgi:hypothetical protein